MMLVFSAVSIHSFIINLTWSNGWLEIVEIVFGIVMQK